MKRVVIPDPIEARARDAADSALAVHRELGPGLQESACRGCHDLELEARGRHIDRGQVLPIDYRGRAIPRALRTDLVVDQAPLIEPKAVESIRPVHHVQVTTYLRLLRDGVHRTLNLEFRTDVPGPDASGANLGSP